jgi:S1-C subfamily serine protease
MKPSFIQHVLLCLCVLLPALVQPAGAQDGTGQILDLERGLRIAPDSNTDKTSTAPAVSAPATTGTGFFVSEDGYLVTTYHVVRERERVMVRMSSQARWLPAKVVKRDARADLVLLKVDAVSKPLTLATAESVPIGLEAYVIGFPLPTVQGRSIKITQGLINGEVHPVRGRRLLQISAQVQTGNSGGPVVSPDGLVVGVVQSKLDALRVAERFKDLPQNVNFALNTESVITFLNNQSLKPWVRTLDVQKSLRPFQLLQMVQEAVVMIMTSAECSGTEC